MSRPTTLLSIFLLLSRLVSPEIIPLSIILDADSSEVHFVRGWLDAPAHVDLSATKFLTTVVPAFDDAFFNDDDDKDNDDWDGSDSPTDFPEDVTLEPGNAATSAPSVPSSDGITTDVPQPAPVAEETNTPTTVGGEVESPAPTSVDVSTVATPAPTSDRRKRRLDENTESLAGGAPRVKQMLDVVFFLIPETCKTNIWGSCDWSTLGVGMRDDRVSGGVNYCCSEDAVSDGLCPSDQMGRLIINPNFFKGEIKTLQVPTEADTEFELDNPLFDVSLTGEYVLLLANCDDYGMDVFSLGSMEWKSVKGYLPGEIFDLMFFYSALTIVYLILVLWYYCGMRMYQDAAIPIQKFILTTIVLGLLEFFFRSLDLGTWNVDGLRSKFIVWLATILGVLKRGIMRCLFVMVSMGWGVVRDSLGLALVKIIILGLVYCALTMLRDFLMVLAVNKVESWSASAEEELVDLLILISLGLVAVNLIFFFWIISSLVATTDYLKNMNQTTKLRRHLRLRCIIMVAFIISLAWVLFSIVDGLVSILTSNQYWLLEGAMHLNNLFVIVSVAILWRPNPNAKDYAMQIELPAMGEDGENELELSCVVPSAGEFDDGNDPDHPDGLPVDRAVQS